jgi:hypothetical protein|tara:strand:- start:465 stop:623 length:159 start_codon:yes stop_codon:yes gene_type:complete
MIFITQQGEIKMDSIIFIIIIFALYVRLYNVKQERNQYKNTLLQNKKREVIQ